MHETKTIIWVWDKKRTLHLYSLLCTYKKWKRIDYFFLSQTWQYHKYSVKFSVHFLSIQCGWDWLRFHNSLLMVFTSQWHQDYMRIKMAQTLFPSLVNDNGNTWSISDRTVLLIKWNGNKTKKYLFNTEFIGFLLHQSNWLTQCWCIDMLL